VWSRPVPPVSPASAVFLTITNGLDTTVTLTGASSEACGAMELHRTTMDDAGVMTMRPLETGLELEAGATGQLTPGAIHLMCMQPTVFEGSFDLELTLRGADPIAVSATIEDR
jgi:copper(I)-binding protein